MTTASKHGVTRYTLTNGRNNQNVVVRDELLGPAVTRTARPPHKLFHLVFESHDGRCYGAAAGISHRSSLI